MEYGDTKPKSSEVTQVEKSRLSTMYRNILYRWEAHRGRNHIPETLDENFVLVWWIKSGMQGKDVPTNYFEYVSNYGAVRLNMWIVNRDKKLLWSMKKCIRWVPDGKTRGKGKQGLQSIHRILQSISDSTGFTIYDLATPNEASNHLLTQEEGYKPFAPEDEENLRQDVDEFDASRWNNLMKTVKSFPSKIKKYTPNHDQLELSARENQEIDTIANVALLDRVNQPQ